MSKIIGIDLGTCMSAVAVMEGGQPTAIVNSEGHRTTPSVVGFTDDEKKVGDPAKRQAITNPKRTVSSIKRFMGERYDNVGKEIERVSYNVVKGDNNTPRVDIDGTLYTPQEISALVLQKLKKTAEEYLGEEVKDAVITVPAYFGDEQRKATTEAGQIAGLNVLRIINEPTAAALSYGIDKTDKERKVCVFDLGGGTMDCTILDLSDGVFEVLSTNGDTHLGGDDFDQEIINYLAEEFAKDNGNIDLRKDPMALQRLKEAAEKAKIELSSNTSTEVNLPYITSLDGVPRHLVITLTRAKFEQITAELVKRSIAPCANAIKDAGISVDDLDEVILVGGSTRIPAIQNAVKEYFKKEPNKSVNPDEAVALGAAIQAGVLAGDVTDVLLLDVTPLNLSIEVMNDVAATMIDANTTIPTKKSQIFSTAENNQPAVTIKVLQGNRPLASQNKTIGLFNLDGIAPAPKGVPQIEVTFDIDANGILNISATDKATGKEQHITIEASSGLSDDEIKRMQEEAKANEESDKKRKEEADLLNECDSFVYHIEKGIEDLGDKITAEDKEDVETKVASLKDSVKDKDFDEIRKKKEELQTKWYSVMQGAYAQGNPDGQQPPFDFSQFTQP